MPNTITGLFIGKFQPFHKGHLFAIKSILPLVGNLIIAIGSSQYQDTEDQPFSAEVRRQMIEETLKQQGIKNFSIVEVSDIHDNNKWVKHLLTFIPKFDLVFTNNILVRRLFEDQGYRVRIFPVLPGVSGTLIRQKIVQQKDWKHLVSMSTAEIIEKHIS
ncbi:nicotinamide-nucleotide adenylyltransferase [Candidatus Daviesbacteria bacterium]|nr:nicotinamide-nucleotide adenylyltransferase [Candidatus Daviesbacteria bacterium]